MRTNCSKSSGAQRAGIRLFVAMCLASAGLLGGCTIRLLSEYDADTDKGVSQLQADMASHLAKLEQLANGPGGKPTVPACQFDNFSDAYAQFSARAHVLTVRNEARSKNEPTTEQLRSLEESIGQLLVAVHRAGNDQCMSSGAIAASTSALDQHFRAILKLELAKKIYRGAE